MAGRGSWKGWNEPAGMGGMKELEDWWNEPDGRVVE